MQNLTHIIIARILTSLTFMETQNIHIDRGVFLLKDDKRPRN